jgi:hypothetical protein
MTLVDMARRVSSARASHTRGMASRTSSAGAHDARGRRLRHRGVDGDFPNILENMLYKVLLAQYGMTPDTWRRSARSAAFPTSARTSATGWASFRSLDALNELGEFKNKSIPDAEKQSLTAGTKGNIIGISRQAIINDDMGAFDSLATMFGRAAALSIEVDVYARSRQRRPRPDADRRAHAVPREPQQHFDAGQRWRRRPSISIASR